MDFERAESPRKGDMLFGRDELVAKEDDLVSEQRGANFSDRRVILFAGKVDPRNFGADPGSQRRDFQTDKAVRRRDGFHGIPLRSLVVKGSWDAGMRRVKSGREPFGASPVRSEERRVGKECVGTCRSRWSPGH